ncbi:MAG: branched-chain amino acid ABC transporter permease [Pseudomonadota bacterium]
MSGNRFAVAGGVVLLVAMALIPFNFPQMNDWLFRIATLVMLAVSWNMMASAGMISLGHSAFWGIGSYGCLAAVNYFKLPFFISFLPALLVGAVVGMLLALSTGRLKGVFFAIATLALSEGLRIFGLMMPDLTGGAAGMFVRHGARPSPNVLYYTAIIFALVAVLVAWKLSRTKIRYAMRAMHDNEDAAQMLGINPLLYRTIISIIAGGMAALAGALNLWHAAYVAPDIAFALHFAILAQIAAIIGGVHTLAGPVIGAFAIIGLSEISRTAVGINEGYSLLIYGVLLVASISFMPNGLYGLLKARTRGQTRTVLSPKDVIQPDPVVKS